MVLAVRRTLRLGPGHGLIASPVVASVLVTAVVPGADKRPGHRMLFVFALTVVPFGAAEARPVRSVR
jgi:hypothetical protein